MRFYPLQPLFETSKAGALALSLCVASVSAASAQQEVDTSHSTERVDGHFEGSLPVTPRESLPADEPLLSEPGPLYVPVIEQEIEKPPSGAIGILRAVDKITARVTDIEAPLDEAAHFGTLQITMRYCYKNPPEDTPEVTAFLEVEDHQPDRKPAKTYTGWMFASSPALSAMEHPVYDVWVIDCKATAPENADGKALKTP